MSQAERDQRRRHLRVRPAPQEPVMVDVNGEDFVDVLPAVDISEGGLGVRVPHQFEGCRLDAEVTVIVSLPEPERYSFTTQARIRHVSRQAFGIMFTRLRPVDQQRIRRYVEHRAYGGSLWRKLLKRPAEA